MVGLELRQEQQTGGMPLSCCHKGFIHTLDPLHRCLENFFLLHTHAHTHITVGGGTVAPNINRLNKAHNYDDKRL